MVPGEASDQSSYCSKLTGLLAIVYMTHAISQCYTIQEGTITIGCDNVSALDMAYGPDNVSSSSADYDILIAIRKTIKKCAITWLPHHISGHQDTKLALSPMRNIAIAKWIMPQRDTCSMDPPHKYPAVPMSPGPYGLMEQNLSTTGRRKCTPRYTRRRSWNIGRKRTNLVRQETLTGKPCIPPWNRAPNTCNGSSQNMPLACVEWVNLC
jgi:hypothetical protein